MASNILDPPPDLMALIAERMTDVPWLMLAEREDSDVHSFFNLTTSEIYEIPLLELWQKSIAGSAHGCLVTIGDDWEIHLFNPLTRVQIKLPPHQDRSFQDHYQGLSCSYHSPPIWFIPSLL